MGRKPSTELICERIIETIKLNTEGKRVAIVWTDDEMSELIALFARKAGVHLAFAFKSDDDDIEIIQESLPRGTIFYHSDNTEESLVKFYHHFSLDHVLTHKTIPGVKTWNPLGTIPPEQLEAIKDEVYSNERFLNVMSS